MTAPRRQLVELAAYLATHAEDPRGPVSVAVTEGRIADYMRRKPRSTSCGDLLHCVAEAAGYRGPALNRATVPGGWVPGVNLSRWFVPPLPHARVWRPRLEDLQPGDFLCYDYAFNRAHAAVFLGRGRSAVSSDDPEAQGFEVAFTADFGQPGGRLYTCPVVHPYTKGAALLLRGRPVDVAVSLDALEWTEPPLGVAEWLEAHGLPVEPWTPFEYLT